MLKLSYSILIFIIFFTKSTGQTTFSIENLQKKHVEALGGEEILNSIESLKITQQVIQGDLVLSNDLIVVNEEKLYSKIKGPAGIIKVAVNGDTGWQVNPFAGINEPTKMNVQELQVWKNQTNLISALAIAEEKNINIKLINKENINDVACYKLLLTYPSGYEITFYVSSENFLVLRSEDKNVEMNYFDYKSVRGFRFPFTTKVKNEMGEITYNVFKLEINPEIDDEIFSFPKN